MSIYNNLSDDEEERVAIHMEESGESLQEIGKILRHGYDCWNPYDPDKVTNRQRLTKEVGDMMIASRLLIKAGDIDEDFLKAHVREKIVRMQKFIRDPYNLSLIQDIAKELGVEQCSLPENELGTQLQLGLPFFVSAMV